MLAPTIRVSPDSEFMIAIDTASVWYCLSFFHVLVTDEVVHRSQKSNAACLPRTNVSQSPCRRSCIYTEMILHVGDGYRTVSVFLFKI